MTNRESSSRCPAEVTTLRTIMIDYNRIGRATTFRTALLSDERDGIGHIFRRFKICLRF